MANKLKARIRDCSLRKEMILEGVVGIVEGLNPTLIRIKLEAYNQEPAKSGKPRPVKDASAPAKAKAGPQPASVRS